MFQVLLAVLETFRAGMMATPVSSCLELRARNLEIVCNSLSRRSSLSKVWLLMAEPGHLLDYKKDINENPTETGRNLSAHNGQWRSVSEVLGHNIDSEPSEGQLCRGGETRVASTHHCDRLFSHDDRVRTTPTLGLSYWARHIYRGD